eukprot:CAMPEP_0184987644 /NCGR_PEP_ID=MMETSP1098-20130426/21193_1 /TAXON_ID=89044 /ORGANISM="Spumella elongata, Strain CCAP 955/1" /LENGTH=53 /DNA_ID=CAMNT_0027512209 /DNA_START=45 /DNA_END=203 /DNA_ORIENTATION=-
MPMEGTPSEESGSGMPPGQRVTQDFSEEGDDYVEEGEGEIDYEYDTDEYSDLD